MRLWAFSGEAHAHTMNAPRKLDEAKRRELAVKASVDPRTIDKVHRGGRVRGMADGRARAALRESGFLNEDDADDPSAA
jgi:hypothetical protein